MADARGGTHDDRRAVALGQVERLLDHGEPLFGRGGVEHRHLGEIAETARVLLGLGGDGAGIVGDVEHEAALDAHVVEAHERVARHVEAHLLAGEQAARTGIRSAGEQLERRLLVGRPLHMHAVRAALRMELGDHLDELGRRRAGISRHDAHARLERRRRERLVRHQEFLGHRSPASPLAFLVIGII